MAQQIKIGSVVAYESNPAKLGEVLEAFTFSASGEIGLKIKPFDNSWPFYLHASEVWVLTDSI
jgi:hypothetical protein